MKCETCKFYKPDPLYYWYPTAVKPTKGHCKLWPIEVPVKASSGCENHTSKGGKDAA